MSQFLLKQVKILSILLLQGQLFKCTSLEVRERVRGNLEQPEAEVK